MDTRIRLDPGTILAFPGMKCTIESFAGQGSNSLVYLGTYPDAEQNSLLHRVLIKELFPYDAKGMIYRDRDSGDILCMPDAKPAQELHRLSFLRANQAHLKLLEHHPSETDGNINTFSLHNTLYSVLGYSGGRSLEKELQNSSGGTLMDHIKRIRGALDALEAFHNENLLHLDVSPDNILLIGEGARERVSLIDFNSVHTIDEIRSGESLYYSAKEGYTPPEIRAGKMTEIGFATDLFSLTAVFYRCIAGEALPAVSMVRNQIPDLKGVPCLLGIPESVLNQVQKILKKGLSFQTRRRYQSTAEMRMDFDELADRIEGRGITHWAIWENSARKVRNLIKMNPALEYLYRDEGFYPISILDEKENRISLRALIRKMNLPGGENVLLLGGGGAGKTSALLHAAGGRKTEYSSCDPAFVYISLYDWRNSGVNFIKDRILEMLFFKPETDSMETARHQLMNLFSQPVKSKSGEVPVAVLLLDGLNEASGNTTELISEIRQFSGLPGVRILAASRTDLPEAGLSGKILSPLEQGQVREILSKHGLVPPENMDLYELLRTPLILTLFIKTAENKEGQLMVSSQKELISRYLETLLEKEKKDLPENSAERWGIEGAVKYVLPGIADALLHSEQPLSDREIAALTEKQYKDITKHAMAEVFPEWTGHFRDILMSAQNADEWYGKIVQDILWKRLGLLVKDEQGSYRIFHEILAENLAEKNEEIQKAFLTQKKKERRIRNLVIAGAAFIMVSGFAVYNSYMLDRVSKAHEETQRSESRALALVSERNLEEGDRRKAVENAYAALPTEEDRPLETEAQAALAQSLYAYQEEAYRPAARITQEDEIVSIQLSEDGSLLVTQDKQSHMRAFDVRTEEMLWEVWAAEPLYGDTYQYSELMGVTGEENSVLWMDNRTLTLTDGKTGEEKKKVLYDDCGIPGRNYGTKAYFSEDKKILAVSVQNDRNGELEGVESDEYLVFYDAETLEVIRCTDVLKVSSFAFMSAGTFSDDGSTFYALYHKPSEDEYVLAAISVESGETLWMKTVSGDEKRTEFDASLTWLEPEGYFPGGVVLYLREYEIGSREGKTKVAFSMNGQDDWNFTEEYPDVGEAHMLPFVDQYDMTLIILVRDRFLQLNLVGHVVKNEVLPAEVLSYRMTNEERSKAELILSDGTVRSYRYDGLRLEAEDMGPRLIDGSVRKGTTIAKNDKVFCVVPEGKTDTVIICAWTGDPHGLEMEAETGTESEDFSYISGDVFVMPDGKTWLYVESDSIEKENSDEYWYRYDFCIIDGGNRETFSVELPVVPATGYFRGFSEDGTEIELGNSRTTWRVNLKTHEAEGPLTPVPEEEIVFSDGRYLLTERYEKGEDRHKLVITDISEDKTVAEYYVETDWEYPDLCIQEDPKTQRVYIYDRGMHLTGLCIDMQNWTVLYRIPHMGGYLDTTDEIISCREDRSSFILYPLYSWEDLADWAREDVLK